MVFRPSDVFFWHLVTCGRGFCQTRPVKLCVAKLYCFRLFVNIVLCATHFQHLENLDSGADPTSCLQLWRTNTHGQRKEVCVGSQLGWKGGVCSLLDPVSAGCAAAFAAGGKTQTPTKASALGGAFSRNRFLCEPTCQQEKKDARCSGAALQVPKHLTKHRYSSKI